MTTFSHLNDVPSEEVTPGVRVRHIYLKNTLLSIIEYAPNASIPTHRHPHEQISLVLEGTVEETIGKEKKRLRKGGIASVRSDVLHSSKAGRNGAKVLCAASPVTKPYTFEPLPDVYNRDRSGDY
ncbi:MAG: cupin domain-containing protein [Planctomycetota bacterium]|nr:cupin domain-containing protein [Planctomycetota bacterium]